MSLADQKREITDKDLESLMSEFHRELDTTENFESFRFRRYLW